jgi:ribosome-associated protein
MDAAVEAALDKKAENVAVLDLRALSDVTDYFIICNGHSSRHVQTIADAIERSLLEKRRRAKHVEGYSRGEWILMDYIDFVVHIFTSERRGYYALDKLWADAPKMNLDGAPAKRGRRTSVGAADAVREEAEDEPA